MTFLSPYWLFAASAVLVPVAIHLWNKRQGKTVKMGSLRWLEASASKRWSSIKLNEVGLLLLRCLLLLLLAVALAQPVLVRPPETPESKKAIYIGEELLYNAAARQQLQPTLDTLLQRGYQLYIYTPEFIQITREQWQRLKNTATDSVIDGSASYWSLLPVLAIRHPQPQDSAWLFTSDQQQFFAGARPAASPQNIRWIPVASEASSLWLQAALQTSPDSLLLLVGQGTREGISYRRHPISATAQSVSVENQQLPLQRQGDSLQIAPPGKHKSTVQVQTEPLQVALLADEAQQPELRYLQAALRAISSYTEMPIHTSLAPDTAADWVFWLRNEEVPPELLQRVAGQGLQLWAQPAAAPAVVAASMPTAGAEAIAVHQLSPTSTQNAQQPVWATSTGEPLLTVQPLGKGHLYRFRSGFSPAWSGLGQSAQLPELLLPLLFPQQDMGIYDVRALDEQQLLPARQPVAAAPEAPEEQRVPLLPWVVAAVFVLFLVERFIAGRRAKL